MFFSFFYAWAKCLGVFLVHRHYSIFCSCFSLNASFIFTEWPCSPASSSPWFFFVHFWHYLCYFWHFPLRFLLGLLCFYANEKLDKPGSIFPINSTDFLPAYDLEYDSCRLWIVLNTLPIIPFNSLSAISPTSFLLGAITIGTVICTGEKIVSIFTLLLFLCWDCKSGVSSLVFFSPFSFVLFIFQILIIFSYSNDVCRVQKYWGGLSLSRTGT